MRLLTSFSAPRLSAAGGGGGSPEQSGKRPVRVILEKKPAHTLVLKLWSHHTKEFTAHIKESLLEDTHKSCFHQAVRVSSIH